MQRGCLADDWYLCHVLCGATFNSAEWVEKGAGQSCERVRCTAKVARYSTYTFRIVAPATAAEATTETCEVEVEREGLSGGIMAS